MNVLFWNLCKNKISSYIEKCILENDIDVAIFAEHSGIDFSKLFLSNSNYNWVESVDIENRIQMVVSSRCCDVDLRQQQDRYAIYTLSYAGKRYVIGGVHLQDRRNSPKTAARIAKIARLKNDIKNVEEKEKSKHTFIIGDFNSNPYDDELLEMDGFNAVLFKDIIKKSETSTYDGIQYRRLYNPILNFLSDGKNKGSFYMNGDFSNPIWNCLDQVVVGKELVDDVIDMEYLTSIGGQPLIAQLAPKKDISDHLPLLVRIKD